MAVIDLKRNGWKYQPRGTFSNKRNQMMDRETVKQEYSSQLQGGEGVWIYR